MKHLVSLARILNTLQTKAQFFSIFIILKQVTTLLYAVIFAGQGVCIGVCAHVTVHVLVY